MSSLIEGFLVEPFCTVNCLWTNDLQKAVPPTSGQTCVYRPLLWSVWRIQLSRSERALKTKSLLFLPWRNCFVLLYISFVSWLLSSRSSHPFSLLQCYAHKNPWKQSVAHSPQGLIWLLPRKPESCRFVKGVESCWETPIPLTEQQFSEWFNDSSSQGTLLIR